MQKSAIQIQQKNTRLNIRTNIEQKKLLTRAAQLKNTTVSDFVLANACEAANEVLAQENNFVLSGEKWEKFCEILDATPKKVPALKKLLMEPGVFDEK